MGYKQTIEKKDDKTICTLELDEPIERGLIPLIAYKMHFFHEKLHKFYIDVEGLKSITFTFENDTDVAEISKLTELTHDLITQEQDALVKRVTKRRIHEKVASSPEIEFKYDKDPAIEMEAKHWIIPFSLGQYFYGPEFTTIQNRLRDLFYQRFTEELGFQEYIFPKMIPSEFYLKSLHLESMPQNLYYVCPPKKAYATFEKVKEEARDTKEIPYELIKSGLNMPKYVMSAFQCDPFYMSIREKPLTKEQFPIRALDVSGPTYRNEGTNCEGLYRLSEFTRMELVYLGEPDQIIELQSKTRVVSEKLLNDLELDWWSEIGDDPFYLSGRADERRSIDLPPDPKYELRVTLPYKSRPNRKAGVSACSFNNHGQHYTEAFDINAQDGTKIWTGCTGIGITRLTLAFLAQKGFDDTNWPELMKNLKK